MIASTSEDGIEEWAEPLESNISDYRVDIPLSDDSKLIVIHVFVRLTQ